VVTTGARRAGTQFDGVTATVSRLACRERRATTSCQLVRHEIHPDRAIREDVLATGDFGEGATDPDGPLQKSPSFRAVRGTSRAAGGRGACWERAGTTTLLSWILRPLTRAGRKTDATSRLLGRWDGWGVDHEDRSGVKRIGTAKGSHAGFPSGVNATPHRPSRREVAKPCRPCASQSLTYESENSSASFVSKSTWTG
jgi:hypothetical protein